VLIWRSAGLIDVAPIGRTDAEGAGYLCVIVAAWLLPETKGIRLDDVGADPGHAEDFNAPVISSQQGPS
jgi:hypothetical protein